jgi:hypothetical protein
MVMVQGRMESNYQKIFSTQSERATFLKKSWEQMQTLKAMFLTGYGE